MTEFINQLDLFKQYQKFKIEIIASDPKRWCLGSAKYQLPTFEYYIENCINDKGGKYDFTRRNYKSYIESKEINVKDSIVDKTIKVSFQVKHSMWMGSAFNFKEEIVIN